MSYLNKNFKKPSEYYIYHWHLSIYIEVVYSYFHLYWCGLPHNCTNANALAGSLADVEGDPVAQYLGYYD
jgi:hypothetical protein